MSSDDEPTPGLGEDEEDEEEEEEEEKEEEGFESEASNWEALGDAGEEQARKELGKNKLTQAIKDIARHLEIHRVVNWTGGAARRKEVKTNRHRLALLLQRRGDAQQPRCTRCQQSGGGLFTECVAAPVIGGAAFQQGSCAACIWGNQACSLRGDTMALDQGSVKRFLAVDEGDYRLRDAIRELEEAATEEREREQLEKARKQKEREKREKEREERKKREEKERKEKEKQEKEQEEARRREERDKGKGTTGSGRDTAPSAPTGPQRNIQTIPSSTFFGAFLPDSQMNRVGVSQRGPRCDFDGDELRWPISRAIWEDPRRLLASRSDLAHFLSIVDARLYEFGEGEEDDSFFWRGEGRRLPALYARPLPPTPNKNVQVPSTQPEKDKTPEVPETQETTEGSVVPETPETRPSKTKPAEKTIAKTPFSAFTKDLLEHVPDTTNTAKKPETKTPSSAFTTDSPLVIPESPGIDREPDNESSDDDLPPSGPRARGTLTKYRLDRGDDSVSKGASTSFGPLASTTATRTVGGSGSAPPKESTASLGGSTAPATKPPSSLDKAIDTLNSIAGFATGSKRRRQDVDRNSQEPPEKKLKKT
ncbi:hypothetical protein BJX64DRAFT_285758 [Aspergillus heterothallicus]